MLAILLYRDSVQMVAWVIGYDLAALKESWAKSGWQVADVVRLDNPWPAVVRQVAYIGQHPADDREFRG